MHRLKPLPYRPPYAVAPMFEFLEARAIAGTEVIDAQARTVSRSLTLGEANRGGAGVAAPELDHSLDRNEPAELRSFPVGELAALLGELTGALEIAAMGGNERKREHVNRRRVPVLGADFVRPGGMLLGLDPSTSLAFDERQHPERTGTDPLIVLTPMPVARLQEGARALDLDRPDKYLSEHDLRPVDLLLVTAG